MLLSILTFWSWGQTHPEDCDCHCREDPAPDCFYLPVRYCRDRRLRSCYRQMPLPKRVQLLGPSLSWIRTPAFCSIHTLPLESVGLSRRPPQMPACFTLADCKGRRCDSGHNLQTIVL